MPRWFRIHILLLLIATQAGAVDAIVAHCTFYDKKPYVEVYWQMSPVSLRFAKMEDGKLAGKMRISCIIRNDTGIIVNEQWFARTPGYASIKEVAAENMLNMRRFDISDGIIKLEMKLDDMVDTMNKFDYKDSFVVNSANTKPFFSDIEFLDTSYKSNQESIFLKNGEQRVPLCANFFDNSRNVLHYYAELYNAERSDVSPLIERTYISQRSLESPYLKYVTVDSVAKKGKQAYPGSFNIEALPSGNYYLNFSLEDRTGVVIASQSTFFQRSNAKPTVAKNDTAATDTGFVNINTLNLNKTFIGKYSLVQAKAILRMLIPVSTAVEMQAIRAFLKKPDDLYMRYFIYNHFSSINPKDPEQAWKDFSNQVREVNKLFGTNETPGYETDRGFVYLKYGKPTERVQVENEVGALPYEVWQYSSLGAKKVGSNQTNAVFLFYRPSEYVTDMRLLHSTIPGEVRNSQWRSILYTKGSTNDPNSRAEQYIGNR